MFLFIIKQIIIQFASSNNVIYYIALIVIYKMLLFVCSVIMDLYGMESNVRFLTVHYLSFSMEKVVNVLPKVMSLITHV